MIFMIYLIFPSNSAAIMPFLLSAILLECPPVGASKSN